MNNETVIERFETFLDRLENSLSVNPQKKREIIDEVRSDLLAQVKGFQEEGKSESEAVDLALEDMGDPEALARSLSEVVPPLSTGPVSGIRYLAAGGLMIWTGFLLWNFRAWTYGFSPGITAGLIAFHLSLVLVIWPGIIWRWNWLFGLLPAGLCLGVALAIQVVGVSSSFSYDLEEASTPEPGVSPLAGYSALAALIGITLLLFYLMQRPQQRRVAIGAACLVFLLVEGYFLIDEVRFRQERDRLLALMNEHPPGGDAALDEDQLGKRPGVRVHLSPEQDTFTLHWARPFASGFSLCYRSEDDHIWVND